MSLLDDIQNKGKGIMDNPDKRAKIEQIAKDKGISIQSAQEHFMKHGDKA